MADLGSRAAVDAAIDALLNNSVPDESIEPDEDNQLRKNILDTLTGLKNTLRTSNATGGYNIDVTSGDTVRYLSGIYNGAIGVTTLTANRTYTLPDKSGTFAMTSDIPTVSGTTNRLAKFTGASALGNSVIVDDGTNIYTTSGSNLNSFASFVTSALQYALTGSNTRTGVDARGVVGTATGTNVANANIGGWFFASGGLTNYAVHLQDGSEGVGKFLTSVTLSGQANWQTINDFANKATPNTAADYVLIYDASTTSHKKALLNSFAVNLSNTNLVFTDDARTATLKTGTTATQNFQLKNSGGVPGLYFDGVGRVMFRTSTVPADISGEPVNLVFGDATNMVTANMYLTNTGASQYTSFRIFGGSAILQYIDSRGGQYWQNQNYSGTDIQFTNYGNSARITTNALNLNVWGTAYEHYAEGFVNIRIDSMGSNTSPRGGRMIYFDGSGVVRNIISSNRYHAHGEVSWFEEGLQIGGTRNNINASALLDLYSTTQGLGIPSMTSAQRSAIASPREGLLVYQNDGTEAVYAYVNSAWTTLGSAGSVLNVGAGTYTPNTSISGVTRTTVTVTVTGALTTDKVVACINDAMRADFVTAGSWFLDMQAYVSAADTVTITYLISTFTAFGASSSINVMVVR